MGSNKFAFSTYYAVGLGMFVSTTIIFAVSRSFFRRLRPIVCYIFLKHIVYAQVAKSIHILKDMTWLDLISVMGILIVNTVAGVVKLHDKADLLRWIGSLLMINLILLAFGGRSNIILDHCGFCSRTIR